MNESSESIFYLRSFIHLVSSQFIGSSRRHWNSLFVNLEMKLIFLCILLAAVVSSEAHSEFYMPTGRRNCWNTLIRSHRTSVLSSSHSNLPKVHTGGRRAPSHHHKTTRSGVRPSCSVWEMRNFIPQNNKNCLCLLSILRRLKVVNIFWYKKAMIFIHKFPETYANGLWEKRNKTLWQIERSESRLALG